MSREISVNTLVVELQVTIDLTLRNHVGVQYQTPAVTPATVGYNCMEPHQAATVALHAGSDLLKIMLNGEFQGGWYFQENDGHTVENQIAKAMTTVVYRLANGQTQRAQLGVAIDQYDDLEGFQRAINQIMSLLRRITDSLGGGRYVNPDEEQGDVIGPDDAMPDQPGA